MKYFRFIETELSGLFVVESTENKSCKSWITYNEEFAPYVKHIEGTYCNYVQENESSSKQYVLRGIHMQLNNPQGKLVRVACGKVFDVAVDARKGSDTFGKWFGIELSSENRKQLLIPEGFLHGFYVMSDQAIFSYRCTRFFCPGDEYGVMWNDPEINIKWPDDAKHTAILAKKDTHNHTFKELKEKLLQ